VKGEERGRCGKSRFLYVHIDKADAKLYGESTMTTLSDLTSRELQILRLVLAGRTNKAIASEIFISEKTVEFHLDNLYTKIGVRTRLMAGLWAMQQGNEVETREIPS